MSALKIGQLVEMQGAKHIVTGLQREGRGKVRVMKYTEGEEYDVLHWEMIDIVPRGMGFAFVPGAVVKRTEVTALQQFIQGA